MLYSRFLMGEILTDLAMVLSNPSNFSLSIVSSSIANTGGPRCCLSIFLLQIYLIEVHLQYFPIKNCM